MTVKASLELTTAQACELGRIADRHGPLSLAPHGPDRLRVTVMTATAACAYAIAVLYPLDARPRSRAAVPIPWASSAAQGRCFARCAAASRRARAA